jgi:hypothetical protein
MALCGRARGLSGSRKDAKTQGEPNPFESRLRFYDPAIPLPCDLCLVGSKGRGNCGCRFEGTWSNGLAVCQAYLKSDKVTGSQSILLGWIFKCTYAAEDA